MFRRDPCRKGHSFEYYGWSVCGFGDYRYHYQCTKCGYGIIAPWQDDEESEEKDGPK